MLKSLKYSNSAVTYQTAIPPSKLLGLLSRKKITKMSYIPHTLKKILLGNVHLDIYKHFYPGWQFPRIHIFHRSLCQCKLSDCSVHRSGTELFRVQENLTSSVPNCSRERTTALKYFNAI